MAVNCRPEPPPVFWLAIGVKPIAGSELGRWPQAALPRPLRIRGRREGGPESLERTCSDQSVSDVGRESGTMIERRVASASERDKCCQQRTQCGACDSSSA